MNVEALAYPALIAAFILGVGSSLHCIGMCGPLVLMLPFHRGDRIFKWTRFLIYGGSKAMVYGLLGSVVGLFGWSIRYTSGQVWLSLLAGFTILFLAFQKNKTHTSLLPKRINSWMVSAYQKVIKQEAWYHFMLAGIFNGFLPCAMILIALSAATATGHPVAAFWFMMVFGLGTLPALALVSLLKMRFYSGWRSRLQWTSRLIAFALAAVLIFRSLPVDFAHSMHHHPTISTCTIPD